MLGTHWLGDWPFRRTGENLSILDIVSFGTIDYKLAGLLWLFMENRASAIVAAGPIWAGKTTLFNALLDFLRPEIKQVSLRGYAEDFQFSPDDKPESTYLVAEEISGHSYEYLWGPQVVKAFQWLSKGYALGSTIHARSVKEVAYVLDALGVPLPQIASLGVIITLQIARGHSYDEPARYVDTVSTVSLTDKGLVAQILAQRQSPDEGFAYPPEQSLHDTLFKKFSVNYTSVSSEMDIRANYLSHLHDKGMSSRQEVRRAISGYYRSRFL